VDLSVEKRLLRRRSGLVAGMDEVGRGSVFGPVAVGVVVTDAKRPFPRGVRDSKLLSANARSGLVSAIKEWALESAVGYASAAEVDEYGILSALCLAGRRALVGLTLAPTWVLLDGSYDWLSRSVLDVPAWPRVAVGEVVTMVKADRSCASVAGASVLAKVERDSLIVEMAGRFPGYGLERHKGYLTKAHASAIVELGATLEHRRSWNLPG
jgi:ribonuclease HII